MDNPNQNLAELKVGGAFYGGWKRLSITRSIEQISGTFELDVTERWAGQSSARPIKPGEPCQVLLGGEPVITGYVDTAEVSYDKQSHSFRVSGRDKTGDLVDCSAIYKTGQWANSKLDRIASDLLEPFKIKVVVETDVGSAFSSYKIQEGETVFECLERAARMKAVLLVSNTAGDLVITRATKQLIPAYLDEGENILSARAEFSWKERFSKYTVKGQDTGNDDQNGAAVAQISGAVTDETINRYRPLIVLAESHGSGVTLRDRAEWERNVRAGRGARGTISVQGWRHAGGDIWRPNTLVRVVSPMIYLDADMLIVGCAYTLDEGGTRTELSIARRESFELLAGIGRSKLGQKLNDKEQKEKKKKGDDWSLE